MKPKGKFQWLTAARFTRQQHEFLEALSVKHEISISEIIRDCVNELMVKEGAI